MMKNIMDIIMWLIVASIIVLVVMHPSATAQELTSGGNVLTHESQILTGSGYVTTKAA